MSIEAFCNKIRKFSHSDVATLNAGLNHDIVAISEEWVPTSGTPDFAYIQDTLNGIEAQADANEYYAAVAAATSGLIVIGDDSTRPRTH